MNTNSQSIFSSRLDAAADSVRHMGAQALVLGPSTDLQYLTGLTVHSSDRPIILCLIPGDTPILRIARIEADGVAAADFLSIHAYGEGDDPIAQTASDMEASAAGGPIAIGDTMWAAWLMRMQSALRGASYIEASCVLAGQRMRKSPDEVELLQRAAERADAAFVRLCTGRFEGRTEGEIARDLDGLLREQGLSPADWGPIVASGPNTASPHHEPGERLIHPGDAVLLDFGGVLEGYQADITRTVHVGPASARFEHVYNLVRAAQDAGVRAVRPGCQAQTVDSAARDTIQAGGYGDFFMHRTGHGVGLECHEEPYIIQGNTLSLEEGMAFSVEPGVYLTGEFGVRIEDLVVVTPEGSQRLNRATHELVIVN